MPSVRYTESACRRRATYVYKDHVRNFIIDVDLLRGVKANKVESWRLGHERSEDAVTWNVFLALMRLGELRAALHVLTGLEAMDEPELYLWGSRVDRGVPALWQTLKGVRGELENGAGIPTEPDLILRVPGQALVLIEAKFGSPNGTLAGKEERFGSVQEFLDSYPPREGSPDPLAREWIAQQPPERVLEQLCRNLIFAQWLVEAGERPFVVNLVKEAQEEGPPFADHLVSNSQVTFKRKTWEGLYRALPVLSSQEATPLRHYLLHKTDRLSKAFAI